MKKFQGLASQLIAQLNKNLSYEEAIAGGRARLEISCDKTAHDVNETVIKWEADPLQNYEQFLTYHVVQYSKRVAPKVQSYGRPSYYYKGGWVPTYRWREIKPNYWVRGELLPLEIIDDDFY